MANNPFDRFSIKRAHPDAEPGMTEEGVVAGEIGGEVSEPADPNVERLNAIEKSVQHDSLLAGIFAEAVGDPQERAGAILDVINRMRQDLERSAADPQFKHDRDVMLSSVSNELRELL